MEKLLYLIGAGPEAAEYVLGALPRQLARLDGRGITVYLPADDVEAGPGLQRHNPTGLLNACVTLWLDNVDDHPAVERALAPAGGPVAGFVVTESVPIRRKLPAAGGGRATPGLGLLAAFGKGPGIDDAAFFANWSSHSALSLALHPLVHYVRNAVLRPLTPGAPRWNGIVTEFTASAEDLLEPDRFYGGDEGRTKATEHIATFVDPDDFHLELVREYVLSREPWTVGRASAG